MPYKQHSAKFRHLQHIYFVDSSYHRNQASQLIKNNAPPKCSQAPFHMAPYRTLQSVPLLWNVLYYSPKMNFGSCNPVIKL